MWIFFWQLCIGIEKLVCLALLFPFPVALFYIAIYTLETCPTSNERNIQTEEDGFNGFKTKRHAL